MKDFGYARATDVASTVAALTRGSATVIAGGTELLNWFRLGISDADDVVDIGDVERVARHHPARRRTDHRGVGDTQ